MKLVLPMAGNGQRFFDEGYDLPKPLIAIKGKPMFKHVIDNIGLTEDIICVVRRDHVEDFNIDDHIRVYYPNANVHIIEHESEGAACTVLEAVAPLTDQQFLVANCDQLMEWSPKSFYDTAQRWKGGSILSFEPDHKIPKHSYVRVGDVGHGPGQMIELKEKRIISNIATVGVYYFGSVHKFLIAVDDMMEANDRTNGEFYLAPVYNYLKDPVGTFKVDQMIGMGTPEELKENWDKI